MYYLFSYTFWGLVIHYRQEGRVKFYACKKDGDGELSQAKGGRGHNKCGGSFNLTIYLFQKGNHSDPESMGRVATPDGDLLTPCPGTLRSTAFTIYESGN